jgi:hypothetical protein
VSYVLILCYSCLDLYTEKQKPTINAILEYNELTVTWTSQIYDIVAIAVIVENAERNFQKTTFVEWNETEESVVVDPTVPYNVTVVVYDRCRESHMSDISSVRPGIETTPTTGSISSLMALHSFPSAEPHPSSPSQCVPTPSQTFVSSSQQECDNRGGIIITLAVLLAFAILLCLLGFCGLIFLWKKKEISSLTSSLKGGFSHPSIQPSNTEL